MSIRFTEAELSLGAEPIWILDLTLGGVVYRFATESISISKGSESLFYEGTLSDVEHSSVLEFASPDFEMPSASVVVTFKDDLAFRIAQGIDFGAATAQLALWIPATDYARRQVVLEGNIDAPSYGAIGEPVTFLIEANWLRNIRTIPGPTAVVDKSVWDDADTNAEGNAYPIIIGAPGNHTFAGSPIYIIDGFGGGTATGLVAGHACTASLVSLWRIQKDGTVTNNYQTPLLLAEDANGNAYSYVTIDAAVYSAGDSFFAMFGEGGGGLLMPGGGLINPYSAGIDVAGPYSSDGDPVSHYLTGGGDLIRYMLHQSGVKVDDGRCAAAAAYLNYFEFEGYIGERTDVLDFLKDEILPLLPCSLRASSDGIYPVVWRYDAKANDAVTKLTANTDIFRDGLVDYSSNEIANEISLKYRYNARYNRLQKMVTVTGDLSKRTSGQLWRTDYSVTSQTRYGTRSLDLETDFITSRASAGRVINWMARAYGARHRTITYTGPRTLGWLEIGDVIALSDADLSLIEQLVLVQSIAWGETDLTIEFLLIPDLPRDTIPVG